jgi:hypothetical protein
VGTVISTPTPTEGDPASGVVIVWTPHHITLPPHPPYNSTCPTTLRLISLRGRRRRSVRLAHFEQKRRD